MDEELLNYMKEYKDLMEQTLARVDALENMVYKEILEPCKALNDEWNYNKRRDEFVGKHGDGLRAFNDKLKAIEGEEFDLAHQVFDDYDKSDKSIGEEEYVAAVISKVQDQLLKISTVFGAPVEVKTTENGDMIVQADGNTVAVAEVIDNNDEHIHAVDGDGDGIKEAVEHEDHEDAGEPKEEENISDKEMEETSSEGSVAGALSTDVISDEEMDTEEEIEALKKELEAEMAREGGNKDE